MSNDLTRPTPYAPIIQMVTNSLDSDHSRRAYGRALASFMSWHTTQGSPVLNKMTVQGYREFLRENDASPTTINLHLTAVKKLAREAVDNGLIDASLLAGIENIKGVKKEGQRTGNWLTKEQAQRLLNIPDKGTLKGKRDRAILAVALGCGLRRSEVVSLTIEHIQQRESRWAIIDLVGKRGRVRSVPMPSWCKSAIDDYTRSIGLSSGVVFRALNKGGVVAGNSISVQTVLDVVREYGVLIGQPSLAPHDLRRTFAKLARNGGAALDQIQLSLGHASVQTTQRYIGDNQSFSAAPADYLGIVTE